ncbi:MAG: ArgR family transcriptional regulator [Salinivirgaceae bacterium]|nr:ArgR family transcriptional regulator [Salinivirgaceae bacterium]
MENKSQRLADIKNILQTEHVTSQETLLQKLLSQGYHITQATLSRDLKLLKVAKMPDGNDSYRYVLPNAITSGHIKNRADKQSVSGFLSIEFSGNLGVVKTIPAFSHTVASAIDNSDIKSIVGTIAGNDTIIFVIREGHTPSDVKKALLKEFPDLLDKLL